MLLVGNGVVRQGASPALRDFCRQTGLHVITTFMGKGVVDADDEHFLFTAGLRAQNYPQGLMGRADLVVCVGYDMVEWPPSAWNPDGRQKIVCIDTVPPEIDAHFVPEVELIGDLGHILTQLGCLLWNKPLATLRACRPTGAPSRACSTSGSDDDFPVKPQRVLRDLRAALAPDDILISDVGAHKLWVARFWEAHEPNTVLISNGFAAMGFGLPAAIAAALAGRGRRKVVCITGDGGFLMNVQELETAKRLGLPLRRARLERRRLRPHRDAPAAQVRARRRARASRTPTSSRWRAPSASTACVYSVPGTCPAVLAKALKAAGPRASSTFR